jgi:hypothetical protein
MPHKKPPFYLLSDIASTALAFAPRLVLWAICLIVFPLSVKSAALSFRVDVLRCSIRRTQGRAQEHPELVTEHVLAHLERAELKECDPWLRDDLRIAWITVLYAAQGNPQAHIDASYNVLGIHPDKVWPAIEARRAALLGKPHPRKKPAASITLRNRKEHPPDAA